MRDDRHGEAVVERLHDGEADAVDGHRALLDQVAQQPVGDAHPKVGNGVDDLAERAVVRHERAVQRLEEIKPGIYRESLTAKNFLGKIDEQSTFNLTDDQRLLPTEYSYIRSVFGRTKTEVQHFDWQNKTLHYQKNDSHKEDQKASENDEVLVFGEAYSISQVAKDIGTIPYEVLTNVSRRVKRVYYQE